VLVIFIRFKGYLDGQFCLQKVQVRLELDVRGKY